MRKIVWGTLAIIAVVLALVLGINAFDETLDPELARVLEKPEPLVTENGMRAYHISIALGEPDAEKAGSEYLASRIRSGVDDPNWREKNHRRNELLANVSKTLGAEKDRVGPLVESNLKLMYSQNDWTPVPIGPGLGPFLDWREPQAAALVQLRREARTRGFESTMKDFDAAGRFVFRVYKSDQESLYHQLIQVSLGIWLDQLIETYRENPAWIKRPSQDWSWLAGLPSIDQKIASERDAGLRNIWTLSTMERDPFALDLQWIGSTFFFQRHRTMNAIWAERRQVGDPSVNVPAAPVFFINPGGESLRRWFQIDVDRHREATARQIERETRLRERIAAFLSAVENRDVSALPAKKKAN